MVCGKKVSLSHLRAAKGQSEPSLCALKLLSCLFEPVELVNGNPNGIMNSKDDVRKTTIKQLDP